MTTQRWLNTEVAMNPIVSLVLESLSRPSLATTQECPVVEAPQVRTDYVASYLPPDARRVQGRAYGRRLAQTQNLRAVQ